MIEGKGPFEKWRNVEPEVRNRVLNCLFTESGVIAQFSTKQARAYSIAYCLLIDAAGTTVEESLQREPTAWQPYDNLSLDEKIRRTRAAMLEFGAYSGPIAKDMRKNKELLLAELERVKASHA